MPYTGTYYKVTWRWSAGGYDAEFQHGIDYMASEMYKLLLKHGAINVRFFVVHFKGEWKEEYSTELKDGNIP